jgi:putative nucleotidyltransferase with HDIG domain
MVDRIRIVKDYVVHTMDAAQRPDLCIAHDYKHVDRVRCWALRIACGEGYANLELIETAALLHDIGLAYVVERAEHGRVGAEVAARYLRERQLYAEDKIDAIADAIRCHNAPPGGGGMLGTILREADTLDALGAVGIMRAFASKYMNPEYDPANVKGETWGLPMRGFEERFAAGKGIGRYIIDQVNFQISFSDNLKTATARRLAEPLVAYMRAYVLQLASEVSGTCT